MTQLIRTNFHVQGTEPVPKLRETLFANSINISITTLDMTSHFGFNHSLCFVGLQPSIAQWKNSRAAPRPPTTYTSILLFSRRPCCGSSENNTFRTPARQKSPRTHVHNPPRSTTIERKTMCNSSGATSSVATHAANHHTLSHSSTVHHIIHCLAV